MPSPVRVLIADDQSLVRSGFAMVLSVEDDIEAVAQASDGVVAVRTLESTPADVVLMDVQMPVMDGITATQQIVARDLAKVIILTTFDREDYLFDALDAGASGFLLKNADPEDLVEAIHAVAGGHALLAPEVTVRVIARLAASGRAAGSAGEMSRPPAGTDWPVSPEPAASSAASTRQEPPPDAGMAETAAAATGADLAPEVRAAVGTLTAREREVLALMAEGLSNTEIAGRLYLGESTVKTHVSHILTKTDSRDRVQAVVLAHKAGLAASW